MNCARVVVVGANERTKIIVFIVILTRAVYSNRESWKFVPIIDSNPTIIQEQLFAYASSFCFFLGSS